MQTKRIITIEDNNAIPLPKGVSWEGIITALKEEKGQQFLKTIDPATFKFILEENNRSKIIQSLLKTLKKIDPQNANEEYAEMTLGAMQKVAQIQNRNNPEINPELQ